MTDGAEARSLREGLVRRFVLRWHMRLVLAGVVAAGVLAGTLLLALGVRSLLVRWLLALGAAYGVFFLLVRVWMAYVASEWSVAGKRATAGVPADAGRRADGSWWAEPLVDLGLGSAESLGEAAMLLLLGILLALLLGAGTYLLWAAPELAGEAAIQALLASGLVGTSRRLEARGWAGSLFRTTAVPFALVLAVAALAGWAIEARCPGAPRLVDVLRRCVRR